MIYRFADLQLDTGRRLLTRNGQAVKLTKLCFEVLKVLVEAAPDLVSHDELIDRVWGPNRVITPENLAQRIHILRDSLGDDAANPTYIEGVRGQGFRLIPKVEVDAPQPETVSRSKYRSWLPAGIAVAVVGIAIAWVAWVQIGEPLDGPDPQSIAVLPFKNIGGDPGNEYMSDGIAEELMNALAQVPQLRVTAQTSSFAFKDQAVDIRTIAQKLGVAHVLEGSVRVSGNKLRITAQLIDSSDGTHEWSETYDHEMQDIFAIQDAITNEVVSALRLTLLDETVEQLDLTRSDNLEAYTEYLKGINEINPSTTDSLRRALAHMQEAIRLDPEYAQAYSTLGLIYLNMAGYGVIGDAEALANAQEAAARALDIAPESPHALAVLGVVEMWQDNYDAAGLLLEKAIQKDPSSVFALRSYGNWLKAQGRCAEAEDVFRRILVLDPLDDYTYVYLVEFLEVHKRIPEALEIIRKWRKALPDSPNVATSEAYLYGFLGKYAEAVRALRTGHADPNDPEVPMLIAWSYLRMDMPDEARHWFDRAIEINPEHPVSLAAPLWLNFYQQQNEEDNVRLARELLANGIANRRGARAVAITVLLESAARSGQYQELLQLLENLYPHLLADPPYDLQRNWRATFWVGLALVNSGDTDRGKRLLSAVKEYYENLETSNLDSVVALLSLGEKDAAISNFRFYARDPTTLHSLFILGLTMLKHSVFFDPIRNEPEFIALLDEYDRNAAEQRQLLQAMEIH